ncbi:Hypothetical predicted protein [Mytilus galloprovincialis]|uniref:C-type lectin domain-containing protein n=1 Tax=Mytilus galloprovincialis TaxID=29158 RepID=A0A8B6CTH1_MYTGA|nr:Hypothetical predicted protein [Mytilus galloprovincialis]
MFIIPVLSESGIELISAQHIPEYDNKYEETNAVETYHVKFVLECAVQCSSHKCCISFFHNRLTGSCILHSDPFVYTIMTLSEEGWSFYLTRERLGRCPIDFFYCRELDFCYQFGPTIQAFDVHNASACPGNDLLRIDSEEKKEYIKLVTADVGLVYNAGICIQGKNTGSGWVYNDGSQMEYFDWARYEPSGLSNVIMVNRYVNYQWAVPRHDSVCSYICEHL